MPNPKANKPLTLEQIKADAMSMGIPARALLDMIYSGGRSAVATTAGLPADIANTAIGLHNMARDVRRRKFEGYEPGTIPGGSEDIKGLIPDLAKDPNSNLNKMADFGGDFMVVPGAGEAAIKGAKALGEHAGHMVASGQRLIPGFPEPQMAMHVIKPEKGGNWVNDTIKEALNPLTKSVLNDEGIKNLAERQGQDVVDRYLKRHVKDVAINNWVNNNLKNYIKNDMATPHDPVRLGIEQRVAKVEANNAKEQKKIAKLYDKLDQAKQMGDEGAARTIEATISDIASEAKDNYNLGIKHAAHVPHENFNFNNEYWGQNLDPSGNQKWMATTEPSKAWEGVADDALGRMNSNRLNDPYEQHYRTISKEQPELLSLKDKNIYSVSDPRYFVNDLGFDHVIDTIKQHLDLPEGDKYHLKPEQLKNISVPQMMERVANHNLEKEIASRNVALQQQEGFPVVKEYPSGHKWIELKMPDPNIEESHVMGNPSGYPDLHAVIDSKTGQSVSVGATPEEAINLYKREERKKQLEDALTYEGDKMGHCVGGYCPDVLQGNTRIFSLRDSRGEPHVTIEARSPSRVMGWQDIKKAGGDPLAIQNEAKLRMGITPEMERELTKSWDGVERKRQQDLLEQNMHNIYVEKFGEPKPYIDQIKGKGNGAPVDKYLPMVQDFQRTTGFPIKGDIQNSGFVDTHPELKKLGESIGLKVPDYLTKDEENVLHQQVAPHIESMVKNANDFLDTHPAFEPHRQATREFNDALSKEFSTNEPVYTQQEMNELERRSLQSIHPEFPYHFNEIKKVLNNPEEHGEGDPLKTQLYNLGKIDELRNKVGDVPAVTPQQTQGLAKGGRVKRKVHVADDADMMRHEIQMKDSPKGFAGGGLVDKMIGKGMSKLFSAVDKTAAELPRAKGTGKEFMTELTKKPGVKKAELADRNLHEINELPKMTKEQFQVELNKRPVPQISKKILSDSTPGEYYSQPVDPERNLPRDPHYVIDGNNERVSDNFINMADAEQHINDLQEQGSQTKYNEYKLPGGKNYQEHLYQLNDRPNLSLVERDGRYHVVDDDGNSIVNYSGPTAANDRLKELEQQQGVYKSSHWDEPNVLAHARTVDRMTPEGKKILHVEEMQSDWHQAGRDKGYKQNALQQYQDEINRLSSKYGVDTQNKSVATIESELNHFLTKDENAKLDQLEEVRKADLTAVPDAPFKKNWEEMVGKDLVKHAIDNGYDAIALTPGKEQADRYNLAKQINELHLSGSNLVAYDHAGNKVIERTGVTPEQLPELIGKEGAQKLMEQPNNNGLRSLVGQQLEVGGEGMKSAYDNRIPNIFNNIGKPHGAEMKLNELPIRTNGLHITEENPDNTWSVHRADPDGINYYQVSTHPTLEEANTKAKELNSTPLHYMEFTPEMKQNVGTDSLPAYADGGQVEHPGFINPSLKLANGQVTLNPLEFMPNYAPGGTVNRHINASEEANDLVTNMNKDQYKKDPMEAFWKSVPASKMLTPMGAGIAAATYSPTLNANEDTELAQRQSMPMTVNTAQGFDPYNLQVGQTANDFSGTGSYKRGGKVHVADDLEMMRHEIHMSEGGAMTNAVLKKMGQFLTKAEKVPAVPLKIPRATPKTPEEIDKIATRVAKQMTGEHVRPENSTKTVNLAGRSMRESERLRGLPYQIQPTGAAQKAEAYTPKIGDVNVAIPGDQTISDSILRHAGDIEDINSIQEGGSRYGLGKMSLEHPLFWASGEDPAQMAQDKITRLAGYYDPERVIGQHLAMGPISNNFAMHLADANLRATDFTKMKPEQMYSFDNIIANGYVKKNAKTGEYEHINFPHWPGIADPEGAYKAMQEDPELRKWYNSRMKTPEITSAHGLPNGLDIQWAITEPALRNMEVNLTGLSAGKMVPGAELTNTASHNTYDKGIQGLALQPQTPPAPFEITYPDATQHVRATKNPSDFTGTIQKVFPHQLVDDQYLNEVGQYNDLIKKYTGQKKGGKVKAKKANKKAKVEITDNINIMRHELSTRG